jgi:hypothetical protein
MCPHDRKKRDRLFLRKQEPESRNPKAGTRKQEPESRNLKAGTRKQEPKSRNLIMYVAPDRDACLRRHDGKPRYYSSYVCSANTAINMNRYESISLPPIPGMYPVSSLALLWGHCPVPVFPCLQRADKQIAFVHPLPVFWPFFW